MGKTTLQIRIDEDLKKEAAKVFEKMHMTLSQAIKLFLGQAVNTKRMPMDVFIPNEETKRVMDEVDAGIGLHEAKSVEEVFEELER